MSAGNMNPIRTMTGMPEVALRPAIPQRTDAERLHEAHEEDRPELREAFDRFVGETFFGQLLSAMRKTVGKPAYFHGGRAEEVFQGQLDQILSERMSQASAHSFADPMFELFNLPRPT